MSVSPGYFHRKQKEKDQKKFLAVQFPFYYVHIPGNLKFLATALLGDIVVFQENR